MAKTAEEKRLAKNKAAAKYYAANKERGKANTIKWRAEHQEEHVLYQKKWRAEHLEEMAAYKTEWYAQNPNWLRNAQHRRRARLRNAPGDHTGDDIKALYAFHDNRCVYCGDDVGSAGHIDHVVPIARGGSNGLENLVLACQRCNTSKGDKLVEEWRQP